MSSALVKQDAAQFPEMGRQLTVQYDRAVGGIREVLVFGAMMLSLQKVVSTCGHNSTHGPQTKGDGLKAWLEQYAPKVSRPTAYRFMELAGGLREEFNLGAKVDLQRLLTVDPKKLEPALAKKREQIFAFVEGKSQRQLLFHFGVAERKAAVYHATRADGTARAERRTKEEMLEAEAREDWDDGYLKKELARMVQEKTYLYLDDARLLELHELLVDLAPAVRDLKAKRGLK